MRQIRVMLWNIHYKKDGAAGYRAVSTLPLAIKAACALMDEGAEVSEVASSGGAKGIDAAELRRLCAERKANKLA
jgi:hypothetical protein